MSFTVGSLLALPDAGTHSLTPGVGEDRPISWAHVCELADPWRWLGKGSLVMTTGIGLPESAAGQRAYFAGMYEAGIAAVTISPGLTAPPIAEEALTFSAGIGFPVLQTEREVPFFSLVTAIADAEETERARRIRQTEQMYSLLRSHPTDGGIDTLLERIGSIIHAELRLEPQNRARLGGHGTIEHVAGLTYEASLHSLSEPNLRFIFEPDAAVDYAVLQHAASIVSSALSIEEASRRNAWLYGSILLNNLVTGSVPRDLARRLVSAHGLSGPFLMVSCHASVSGSTFDAAQLIFVSSRVPALATIKDHHLLVIIGEGPQSIEAISQLADAVGSVGVSAQFTEVDKVPEAAQQAQIALSRTAQSAEAEVVRFDAGTPVSLFLPNEPSQLRAIAAQVLGALQDYDQQKGSPLMQTLQVFLEENRSWVRAAERLFVHRQTLIARISRIETIINRDLNSMEDTAECWFAIRAAVAGGMIAPSHFEGNFGVSSDAQEGDPV